MAELLVCQDKHLPEHLAAEALATACTVNPANAVSVQRFQALTGLALQPEHLAVMTQRYWGPGGVRLTVGFPFDNPSLALRKKILAHANAWGASANVQFTETTINPQVRIARTPGDGYWSYLGTDILSIPANQPTLNLDSFSEQTPDSEFFRVVRHEVGHTLGAPHEHLRKDLVARLDPQKTIAYFMRTQGWSRQTVIDQVLTPLNEASLMSTPVDVVSIMCYQLPGSITVDGRAIPGGTDIDASDAAFMAKVYPKPDAPPPPPPPPGNGVLVTLASALQAGSYLVTPAAAKDFFARVKKCDLLEGSSQPSVPLEKLTRTELRGQLADRLESLFEKVAGDDKLFGGLCDLLGLSS